MISILGTDTEMAVLVLPVLEEGDTGPMVKLVQLITVIKTDSVFGPKTSVAVRDAQKKFLLPETGIVDAETWRKLLGVS